MDFRHRYYYNDFCLVIIRMGLITVNLTPPLSGVLGALYYVYGDVYNKIYDMPPSENGFIQIYMTTGNPLDQFAIIFPEQNIGGVTYLEAETPLFTLVSPVTFNITLETPEPPVPPTPPIEIKSIAIPGAVGIVLLFTLLRV